MDGVVGQLREQMTGVMQQTQSLFEENAQLRAALAAAEGAGVQDLTLAAHDELATDEPAADEPAADELALDDSAADESATLTDDNACASAPSDENC